MTTPTGRRDFLKSSLTGAGAARARAQPSHDCGRSGAARAAAAGAAADSVRRHRTQPRPHLRPVRSRDSRRRPTGQVLRDQPELIAQFQKRYPQVALAKSEQEILDDPNIKLVVSASIASDRAPLGIRVMKAGKDFMSDKPAMTTLEQLAEVRKVQAETRRI